jgi:hypothetical protein
MEKDPKNPLIVVYYMVVELSRHMYRLSEIIPGGSELTKKFKLYNPILNRLMSEVENEVIDQREEDER